MKAFVNRYSALEDAIYPRNQLPALFDKLGVDIIIHQDEDVWEGGQNAGIILLKGETGEYRYHGSCRYSASDIEKDAKEAQSIEEFLARVCRHTQLSYIHPVTGRPYDLN
jgi:hypothetical protein